MIINLDEVDSTNEYLKRMVEDGYDSDEMLTVTAQFQTAGKGRRGRQWFSDPGTALMFSVLVKPKLAMDDFSMITLIMAMAVRQSLKDIDIDPRIKWPNDIVLGEKKICGILTEALLESKRLIVGVGINTNQESIPQELKDSATSILLETDDCVDHDSLLDSILFNFEKLLDRLSESGDMTDLKSEYEEALVSLDKEVTVLDPTGEFNGTCKGIDNKGQLIVSHEGQDTYVYAGEVSVRGIYGYV
ncbi:MAG: biotin--[acetyl-CoA-carboxylase] ligase [Lachnospiraceae bacterium]|nr:biotin--[acetyl-CoA-carboxylase] ligase [Lachnospiraceae bacterium]